MSTVSSTSSTGTVVTTGSTTYISSTASGLDTASLINTAVATKSAMATTLNAEVTANKSKISAYSEVQTLMSSLSSSIDALASTTNLSSGVSSAFASKTASVTSSDASVSASSVLEASATSSAQAGTYQVTVDQLAKSMKVASSAMDDSTALGETGTFTLSAADGTATTFSVTSGMTLSDVASAISAKSSTTGVDATLVKVSTGSYKLVLTSANTGQAITAKAASGDDVLNSIGLTGSDGSFTNVVQAAQSAQITLDGTTITRSSNTMSDVISGVTLNLDATSASGDSLTLTVGENVSGVESAVQSFISSYNSLHEYLATQESETNGTVSSTAYLFADTTLRSMNSELGTLLTGSSASGSSNGSSSAISYLAQLGVTLNSSNELTLNSSTLSSALSSNPSAVQDFFQSSFTTSDSSLSLISNKSTVSGSFTLNITASASGISGVTVNGQSGLFTVSGNELVGAKGTAYAGLTFAIGATTDKSVTVNLQQGFADSVVSLARQYGDTSSGSLASQITSLTDDDTALSNEANQILSAASDYQTYLISKYATMETEISSAKIVQDEIQAILNGSSSTSG